MVIDFANYFSEFTSISSNVVLEVLSWILNDTQLTGIICFWYRNKDIGEVVYSEGFGALCKLMNVPKKTSSAFNCKDKTWRFMLITMTGILYVIHVEAWEVDVIDVIDHHVDVIWIGSQFHVSRQQRSICKPLIKFLFSWVDEKQASRAFFIQWYSSMFHVIFGSFMRAIRTHQVIKSILWISKHTTFNSLRMQFHCSWYSNLFEQSLAFVQIGNWSSWNKFSSQKRFTDNTIHMIQRAANRSL